MSIDKEIGKKFFSFLILTVIHLEIRIKCYKRKPCNEVLVYTKHLFLDKTFFLNLIKKIYILNHFKN